MVNTREPSRNPNRCRLHMLLLFLCAALMLPLAVAAQSPSLLQTYDVPGSPQAIAVDSPSRVWFTLPEEGAIGLLTLDIQGSPGVEVYHVELGSDPVDVAYADGQVWWISRAGDRIGRIDVTSGTMETFETGVHHVHVPIVSGGAAPAQGPEAVEVVPVPAARLAVAPGDAPTVWFTVPRDGRIGRLVVDGGAEPATMLWALPSGVGASAPADIAVQSASRIWITVPGRSLLYQLQVTSGVFVPVQTGAGSEPWSLAMSGGYPWFTDIAGNRIGSWNPSTLSIIYWRALPHADSRPYGIDAWGGYVWFTEASGQRVGRLSATSFRDLQEFRLPGTSPAPAGIAVDSEGSAWIAAQGADQIMRWQSPYFERTWLPLVFR